MSEPVIIKPTIGRRVWFWPDRSLHYYPMGDSDSSQPWDAGIAYVHNDRLINISAADHNGDMHSFCSVPLIQAGETPPEHGFYCEWMPYQQVQAKKHVEVGVTPCSDSAATTGTAPLPDAAMRV